MVFSNKIVLVSLLVLGLLLSQPTQGEARLEKRIAGGFQAQQGQFPFIVLINYNYNDGTGQFTYQGTGVIYDLGVILTSNQVFTNLVNCNSPSTTSCDITIIQGVTDINNIDPALTITKVVNVDITSPTTIQNVITNYQPTIDINNDLVFVQLGTNTYPSGLNYVIRLPTSSLTQADVGKTYAIGFGEIQPATVPFPQLNYVQINPLNFHECSKKIISGSNNLLKTVDFSTSFCVQGFVKGPNNVTTDICTLDVGGALIRTTAIATPVPDYEVVGIISFGSCSAKLPAILSYVWQANENFPQTAANAPAPGNPANPRAFDGNFACGDGVIESGQLEKCEESASGNDACCNLFTCQFKKGGTLCGPKDGTRCQQAARCDGKGTCVPDGPRPNRKGNCNKNVTYTTRCNKQGQCCGTLNGQLICT